VPVEKSGDGAGCCGCGGAGDVVRGHGGGHARV
jgi:hypothetical protein